MLQSENLRRRVGCEREIALQPPRQYGLWENYDRIERLLARCGRGGCATLWREVGWHDGVVWLIPARPVRPAVPAAALSPSPSPSPSPGPSDPPQARSYNPPTHPSTLPPPHTRPITPLISAMDDLFNPPSAEAEPSVEDFLAREAAALGPDAHSFSTPGAAQDKDFEASASAFPDLDGEGDFVAGPAALVGSTTGGQFGAEEGGQVSVTNNNQYGAFEEEYPAVEVGGQEDNQVSNCQYG